MSHITKFAPKPEKKSVVHIYAFAVTWILGVASLIREMEFTSFTLIESLLGLFILSFFVSKLVQIICRIRAKRQKNRSTSVSNQTTNFHHNPMLEERALLKELEAITDRIQTRDIKVKANEIVKLANSIFHKIQKDPQLITSMNRFFNYYLPTAIKLLTKYSDLEKQTIISGNIIAAKEKIDQTLDMLKNAFQKKLDNLYSNTVLELETDMDVLESILKKEGFIEDIFINNTHKGE